MSHAVPALSDPWPNATANALARHRRFPRCQRLLRHLRFGKYDAVKRSGVIILHCPQSLLSPVELQVPSGNTGVVDLVEVTEGLGIIEASICLGFNERQLAELVSRTSDGSPFQKAETLLICFNSLLNFPYLHTAARHLNALAHTLPRSWLDSGALLSRCAFLDAPRLWAAHALRSGDPERSRKEIESLLEDPEAHLESVAAILAASFDLLRLRTVFKTNRNYEAGKLLRDGLVLLREIPREVLLLLERAWENRKINLILWLWVSFQRAPVEPDFPIGSTRAPRVFATCALHNHVLPSYDLSLEHWLSRFAIAQCPRWWESAGSRGDELVEMLVFDIFDDPELGLWHSSSLMDESRHLPGYFGVACRNLSQYPRALPAKAIRQLARRNAKDPDLSISRARAAFFCRCQLLSVFPSQNAAAVFDALDDEHNVVDSIAFESPGKADAMLRTYRNILTTLKESRVMPTTGIKSIHLFDYFIEDMSREDLSAFVSGDDPSTSAILVRRVSDLGLPVPEATLNRWVDLALERSLGVKSQVSAGRPWAGLLPMLFERFPETQRSILGKLAHAIRIEPPGETRNFARLLSLVSVKQPTSDLLDLIQREAHGSVERRRLILSAIHSDTVNLGLRPYLSKWYLTSFG